MEVENEDLNDVAAIYRNLTDGIELDKNDTMSNYIMKQASYSLFLLTWSFLQSSKILSKFINPSHTTFNSFFDFTYCHISHL